MTKALRWTGILLLLMGTGTMIEAQTTRLYGQVLDRDNGSYIEYASVALYSLQDTTILAGVITDTTGRFELSFSMDQATFVRIQFMGYETFDTLGYGEGTVIDLGTVYLEIASAALQEIQVSARAYTSLHKIDRQVFSANQFESARNGSALDVIKNLPSVAVDVEGNISVRGSNGFQLMINGKPIQADPKVLLQQLPANSVEDIEIITAPSARYDPDGKAGIINIKTKQGATDGLYLTINSHWGLPSVEPYGNTEMPYRFGADVTLQYSQKKWDLSAGFDYRRNDISGLRVGYVNTYIDEVLTEYPSMGERSFDREQYTGRFTVAYTPAQGHSLSLGTYAGKRTQYRTADILYDQQRRTQVPDSQWLGPESYWEYYRTNGQLSPQEQVLNTLTYFNENLRVRRGDFFLSSLDYQRTWSNQSSLSLSALYEHTLLGGPTDNRNLGYPNLMDSLQVQFNDNVNPLDGVRLQADYQWTGASSIWEWGYQFRFLQHPGDFEYLDRDFSKDRWVVNPEFTNRIDLRRSIHAGYMQWNASWDRLSVSAGIRVEHFDRRVALAAPDTAYHLGQWNPFPTLNVQYETEAGWRLKAGYSRRIQRTTTFSLTPFPEREHSETLEQGDAELLPEFIDLVEAGAVKQWEDNTLFATIYYRQTENVINRVNTVYNDTILNRIYTNAGNAEALGFEWGFTFFPASWCQFNAGNNIYRYRIQGQLFGEDINTSNTIFSINAQSTFTLMPTWTLQVGLNYLSDRVTAQGTDSRFYNPSMTIRKSLLEDRLSIVLQWLNMDLGLLQSNEQRITTSRENFFTTTNYIYEVDIFNLQVSYRLNQPLKDARLLRSEFGDREF